MINKKQNISFGKVIFRIIPMVFASCPVYFIISNIIGTMHGLSHGLKVLATQKFFDSVSLLLLYDNIFEKVILIAILLALSYVMCQILSGVHNFMLNNTEDIAAGYIEQKINEKAGRLDIIAFENTEYIDDIKRAKEGIRGSAKITSILANLLTLYLPYFAFMGTYLYSLKPVLIISLILIFIPTCINQFIRMKIFTDLADKSGPIKREYEYYESCIADREYFKETRILGAFYYFKERYIKSLSLLNKEVWKTEKKAGIIELFMRLLTVSGYMGVLYLLFISLLNGEITTGAFAAVLSSLSFMLVVMEEIMYLRIGEISNSLGTVKNLIRFLDMPERTGKDDKIEKNFDIVLDNVSFSYPGATEPSISDVSLKINSGETIAVVGENGSGKTTLIKIIIGLYTPTKGTVLIGGKDTSKLSGKSMYENISAVFQKYQRYKMTLGENIEISSLNNIIDKSRVQRNKFLEEAVLKSELELNEMNFENNYDTMLSREFDGIDLSGGQWQKIAIARGYYKDHSMIVLDEPTAAIDPVMETNLYNKFAELAEEKTAVIVTHRLGSAKIGDRIIVMDRGRIVEMGTHDELIKINEKYAEMYNTQSKWYSV